MMLKMLSLLLLLLLLLLYNTLLIKGECWIIVTSKNILHVFYWCNLSEMLLFHRQDDIIVLGR